MTFFRKIRTVLRYVFPSAQDRAYLAQIAAAGQFDRAFYLTANPRLPALFRIWPERHYIQLGEGHGLCPNPRFSPRAYLFNNPDLLNAARQPLLHYIETGRAENRTVLAAPGAAPPMPKITPSSRDAAEVAILAHVFYPDFWDEIAPVLAAQSFAFDLFVTLTANQTDATGAETLRARILAAFPQAQVWVMPNHGRDIWPFVHLVNAGVFAPYRALCKLHSKKSPHRGDGDQWRQSLIKGILGDPARTATRLARFLADDKAGFWVADGHAYCGNDRWGINRTQGLALLARAGIDARLNPGAMTLEFPAGSIYWVKLQILDSLRHLGLAADEFEPEQALVDGTLAHAIERSIGLLAKIQGLTIRESHMLDSPPEPYHSLLPDDRR